MILKDIVVEELMKPNKILGFYLCSNYPPYGDHSEKVWFVNVDIQYDMISTYIIYTI